MVSIISTLHVKKYFHDSQNWQSTNNISQTHICKTNIYRIGEVIDEDVLHTRVPFVARTQQCFAVKAGIDGLLDIARRSFCDTSEGLCFSYIYIFLFSSQNVSLVVLIGVKIAAIHNLANKYREDYKLPKLKIPFNNRQGFYFSIPQKDINGKLPSKFIQVSSDIYFLLKLLPGHFANSVNAPCTKQVVKHGNNTHCSTLELASVSILSITCRSIHLLKCKLCCDCIYWCWKLQPF